MKTKKNMNKLFCVVRWTGGPGSTVPDGGFVVRTGHLREDGTIWIPEPYSGAFIHGRDVSERRAQKLADDFNFADLKGQTKWLLRCPQKQESRIN